MNEEKSLHHVKGLPMSLVNSTEKLYDDNEQDEYGNDSSTDVHKNDTDEMTRIPKITAEELQAAINKLKKMQITRLGSEPKTSKHATMRQKTW